MRKRLVRLGVILAVLAVVAAGYVLTGAQLYRQYRVAYANFQNSCDNLITWTPPTQILTGFYPNAPELVTLRYRSPVPEQLTIHLSIPNFTQEQVAEVAAGPTFQQYTFKPPLLNGSVLDSLIGSQQRAAQIRLQVRSGDNTLCDTGVPVTLLSRQIIRWREPNGTDNMPYLAGWVTPHAQVIDELKGRATLHLEQHQQDYEGLTALIGYDQGRATPEQVRQQVNLLFDTLREDYNLRYAEENIPFTSDQTQLVRLPADILGHDTPTGMCVETTAILAAAVESLGMRPYIMIRPGHAFLGVAVGAQTGAPIEYWETSDLNSGADGAQANLHGDQEYTTYKSQILNVVDITLERQQGITPIE